MKILKLFIIQCFRKLSFKKNTIVSVSHSKWRKKKMEEIGLQPQEKVPVCTVNEVLTKQHV